MKTPDGIKKEYYNWLNMPIEEKYNFAYSEYKNKFPTGSLSDFHLMEIETHEKSIKIIEALQNPEWHVTKQLIEHRKLLLYFQSFTNQKGKAGAKKAKGRPKVENWTSFNWQVNPDNELPILYERMNDKFIEPVTLDQFKETFTGQPIERIIKLKWKENKSLLAYFIDQIYELNKISDKDFWSIAKHTFHDAENLKSSKQSYLNNDKHLPIGHSKIDQLFENL